MTSRDLHWFRGVCVAVVLMCGVWVLRHTPQTGYVKVGLGVEYLLLALFLGVLPVPKDT